MDLRILQSADRDLVMEYGRRQLARDHSDEMDLEMASWAAPWRAESLDHYLRLGWSFAAHESGNPEKLAGFALAQPILFFRGATQSVWVETIVGDNEKIRHSLLETLYRWARDKHIQKLVLHATIEFESVPWPVQKIGNDWQISTTRGQG